MNDDDLTSDLALDAICVKFEHALRRSEQPQIEAFLREASSLDERKLVAQLILLETEYFATQNRLPPAEHYIDRFPQYRAAIKAIIEAVKVGKSFDTAEHLPAEKPGTSIGHYRLLEQIGEGGMGVVFMAEQMKPVRRKVALKIIKPGMDTKQVIARFEAERQALAMMDHVNIARVLDAGSTDSGRPYFVMELVRGVPITEYCDQNKLPTPERLELFVSVCQAVQHAHTKGIIHRDIKPSNVLVTLHDGIPIPKIIDFGVAKATNQQLTERTLFTAYAQMIGTPLYMSPEQAEMSGLDVDTRSDIYSLGVLLYELLTGTTPVDRKRMSTAAFDEIRRIIREEDPAKPSTAISTLGEEAKTVSGRRGTDANTLRQSLTGEIDWIVLKALEKDRTRRFQTASDFADDVRRHLDGDTVEACPPTWKYRFRKFANRYRTQVAVAVLFVSLLFASSLVAWGLYASAQHARAIAESATEREGEAKNAAIVAKQEAIHQRDIAITQQAAAESLASRLNQSLYNYNFTLAAEAFRDDDHERTRELLDKCDEPSRGWEWKYLKGALPAEETRSIPGDPMTRFDISPDGTMLAAVDTNQQLRVHDFDSGKLIWSRTTNDTSTGYMEFSPDGKRIGVASFYMSNNGKITVWDVETGDQVWQYDEGANVGMFKFRSDGRGIVLGRLSKSGGGIEYFRLDDGESRWTYACPGFPAFDLSPDDNHIYISVVSGTDVDNPSVLHCISAADGTEVWGDIDRPTSSMVLSTLDGKHLITNGARGGTTIRDSVSGREVESFDSGHDEGWFFGHLDPTGRYLATYNNNDNDFVLYDLAERMVVVREPSTARSVPVFSPDGSKIVSLGLDGTSLRSRETRPNSVRLVFQGHEGNVKGGSFTASGRHFRTASVDQTVRQWNLTTGLEESVLDIGRSIFAIAESTTHFATGAGDGVKLWDATTNRLIHHWGDLGQVYWVDFNQKGTRIVAGGMKKGVTILDTETHQILAFLDDPQHFDGIRFCDPEGTKVALLASRLGEIRIWNTVTQGIDRLKNDHGSPRSRGIAVSPDFRWLAAGNGAAADVWHNTDLTLHHTLRGSGSDITSVEFSATGSRLFTGSRDGILEVWDTESGEPYLSVEAHRSAKTPGDKSGPRGIETIAASATSDAIVTCGADGLVKVWEVDIPEPETQYQRRRVRKAATIVNGAYKKHHQSAEKIINEVLADPTVEQPVRQLAIHMVNERGDRPNPPFEVSDSQSDLFHRDIHDSAASLRTDFHKFLELASGVPINHSADWIDPKGKWFEECLGLVEPSKCSLTEIEALTSHLIIAYPHAHQPRLIRGRSYANHGQWEQASDDLAVAIRFIRPETSLWFYMANFAAPIHVLTGNRDRFEFICESASHHAFNSDPRTAERTAKMILCSSSKTVKAEAIAKHLRNHPYKANLNWYQFGLALAEYRSANFGPALREVESACELHNVRLLKVLALALRAMIRHQLKDQESAQSDLAAAEQFTREPTYPPNDQGVYENPVDWLYAQVLLNEARNLIRSKSE